MVLLLNALNKQMQSSQPNRLKFPSSKCLCNEKKQKGIIP